MPIFRRKNFILTASGIVALCKRLHSTPVKSGLESALNRCTVPTGNRPRTSLLDTYHPDQWRAPVAATTVFSVPDDGRR